MGYGVSPQFASFLIFKFDTMGRRSMTLDNFIQACVMLKSLTDAFRTKDTSMRGIVPMNYDDFMCLALLNKP